MKRIRVLFRSCGDSTPGAMAAAFLAQCAGDRFEARYSREHAASCDSLAVRAMEEAWVDMEASPAAEESDGACGGYDLVVTIDAAGRDEQSAEGGARWRIEVPPASVCGESGRLEAWRRVRAAISGKVIDLARLFCGAQRLGHGLPGGEAPGCPA